MYISKIQNLKDNEKKIRIDGKYILSTGGRYISVMRDGQRFDIYCNTAIFENATVYMMRGAVANAEDVQKLYFASGSESGKIIQNSYFMIEGQNFDLVIRKRDKIQLMRVGNAEKFEIKKIHESIQFAE